MIGHLLGIDPGLHGGIAVLKHDGSLHSTHPMPPTDRDLLDLLTPCVGAHAVLEKVGSSPQMGVASAFTFGRGIGAIHMALCAAGIPVIEVAPLKWQRVLGCLSGGDKNVTKQAAQRLFPHIKVTHAIADALLLAEYARRVAWVGVADAL